MRHLGDELARPSARHAAPPSSPKGFVLGQRMFEPLGPSRNLPFHHGIPMHSSPRSRTFYTLFLAGLIGCGSQEESVPALSDNPSAYADASSDVPAAVPPPDADPADASQFDSGPVPADVGVDCGDLDNGLPLYSWIGWEPGSEPPPCEDPCMRESQGALWRVAEQCWQLRPGAGATIMCVRDSLATDAPIYYSIPELGVLYSNQGFMALDRVFESSLLPPSGVPLPEDGEGPFCDW
jgi:hypothetical protein